MSACGHSPYDCADDRCRADGICGKAPKFQVGEDVFVRDPQRFIADCTCITGPVAEIVERGAGYAYRLAASVGRMGGGYQRELTMAERDIGHRPGTPISQLSGRPGHRGFGEFCRIAATWGHD